MFLKTRNKYYCLHGKLLDIMEVLSGIDNIKVTLLILPLVRASRPNRTRSHSVPADPHLLPPSFSHLYRGHSQPFQLGLATQVRQLFNSTIFNTWCPTKLYPCCSNKSENCRENGAFLGYPVCFHKSVCSFKIASSDTSMKKYED